jgi:hypothetical protein
MFEACQERCDSRVVPDLDQQAVANSRSSGPQRIRFELAKMSDLTECGLSNAGTSRLHVPILELGQFQSLENSGAIASFTRAS